MIRVTACNIVLLSFLFAGCTGQAPTGTPIAAEELCGRIATILCAADVSCCGGEGGMPCLTAQTTDCDQTLGALLADPRFGYVPEHGGDLLDRLQANAAQCWTDPLQVSDVMGLFEGTGDVGTTCTAANTGTMLSASAARDGALSCAADSACRIHLATDGRVQGICEARETSDASACSHPFDCPSDQFCDISSDWQPGDWGHCRPLLADGWGCNSAMECASGYCGTGGCGPRPELQRCLSIHYADLVLSSSPILYLRLGDAGTSTAADASGNGRSGTYVDPVTAATTGALTSADDDGALSLDGMGGHVGVSMVQGLATDAGISIELWVAKAADGSGGGPLVELVSPDGVVMALRLDDTTVVASFLGAMDQMTTELASPADAIGDGFHHVALTYDGTTTSLFVDGASVATLDGARAIPVGASLALGFHDDADPANQTSLTGTLDEVALYASALSASTLGMHVQAGREGPIANELPLFAWSR